jgi:hypothetical protein
MALDRASGPPLHLHPTHGEGFDVLAGERTAARIRVTGRRHHGLA